MYRVFLNLFVEDRGYIRVIEIDLSGYDDRELETNLAMIIDKQYHTEKKIHIKNDRILDIGMAITGMFK